MRCIYRSIDAEVVTTAMGGHARAVVHAGIANPRFPLKAVAGKTFPAFPAHAKPTILRIW